MRVLGSIMTPDVTIRRMTREEIESDPIWKFRWYHRLELLPDLFTPTEGHANVIATRTMLRGCDVAGARCLEVGAMDGMLAYLMERRGASHVYAYDRWSRYGEAYSNGDRFRFIHRHFESKVEHVWNIPLRDLPEVVDP